MTDSYKDFQREPSRAHQCMHESENDGTRCRAMAMQNNYMCYAHRTDDVPTVIENDMFLIDNLDTHAAIQKVFLDVAARLACNHIDLKRAELLITLLRAASRNLRAASRNLRDAAAARRRGQSRRRRRGQSRRRRRGCGCGCGCGCPRFDGFIVDPGVKSRRPPSELSS
jgi:CO/xanthine dehydrogenase Mo-binding subunit